MHISRNCLYGDGGPAARVPQPRGSPGLAVGAMAQRCAKLMAKAKLRPHNEDIHSSYAAFSWS